MTEGHLVGRGETGRRLSLSVWKHATILTVVLTNLRFNLSRNMALDTSELSCMTQSSLNLFVSSH